MVEGAETTEAGLEGGLKKKPLDESGDAKTVLTGAAAGEIVARVSEKGLGSEQVVMEIRGVVGKLIEAELVEAMGKVVGMFMDL